MLGNSVGNFEWWMQWFWHNSCYFCKCLILLIRLIYFSLGELHVFPTHSACTVVTRCLINLSAFMLSAVKIFVQSKQCGLSSINSNICKSKREIFCIIFSAFKIFTDHFSTSTGRVIFTWTNFIISIFPLITIQKFSQHRKGC